MDTSDAGSQHSKFSKLSKFSAQRRRIVTVDHDLMEDVHKEVIKDKKEELNQ